MRLAKVFEPSRTRAIVYAVALAVSLAVLATHAEASGGIILVQVPTEGTEVGAVGVYLGEERQACLDAVQGEELRVSVVASESDNGTDVIAYSYRGAGCVSPVSLPSNGLPVTVPAAVLISESVGEINVTASATGFRPQSVLLVGDGEPLDCHELSGQALTKVPKPPGIGELVAVGFSGLECKDFYGDDSNALAVAVPEPPTLCLESCR